MVLAHGQGEFAGVCPKLCGTQRFIQVGGQALIWPACRVLCHQRIQAPGRARVFIARHMLRGHVFMGWCRLPWRVFTGPCQCQPFRQMPVPFTQRLTRAVCRGCRTGCRCCGQRQTHADSAGQTFSDIGRDTLAVVFQTEDGTPCRGRGNGQRQIHPGLGGRCLSQAGDVQPGQGQVPVKVLLGYHHDMQVITAVIQPFPAQILQPERGNVPEGERLHDLCLDGLQSLGPGLLSGKVEAAQKGVRQKGCAVFQIGIMPPGFGEPDAHRAVEHVELLQGKGQGAQAPHEWGDTAAVRSPVVPGNDKTGQRAAALFTPSGRRDAGATGL